MFQKTKKLISSILVLAMMSTCGALHVFAKAGIGEDLLVRYEEFEQGKVFGSGGKTLNSDSGEERHGKVLEILPTPTLSYSEASFTLENKSYMISFDFKAQQTDHPFRIMFRDTNGKDFAHLSLDSHDNIVVSLNGWSLWNLKPSAYNGTDFEAVGGYGTDWHNVLMLVNPDGENTTLEYYVDGQYVASANTTYSEMKGESGILNKIYIASTEDGKNFGAEDIVYDGNESLYIDNLIVSYADSDYVFPQVMEANASDGIIKVNMMEPLSEESYLSEVRIVNSEDGSEISADNVETEFNRCYIEISEELENDTEYFIMFPEDIKTASGKEFFSEKVYFVPESGKTGMPEFDRTIAVRDFEELELGAATSAWSSNIAVDCLNGISAVLKTQKDGTEGNVLRFEQVSNSNYVRLEDGATRFTDSDSESKVLVSIDIQKETEHRTSNFNLYPNLGMFFIDSFGNFVFLNTATAGELWSTSDVDIENGETYDLKHVAIDADIEVGEWVTVTALIDKGQRTVAYYLDGDLAGTAVIPTTANTTVFKGIRLSVNTDKDNRAYCLDNFTIGYPKSADKLIKVRLQDKKNITYGGKDDDVPVNIIKGSLYFTSPIDEASVDYDTLKITNGESEVLWENGSFDYDKNVFTFDICEFLEKGCEYQIIAEGISNDNGVIPRYETSFTTSGDGEFIVDKFYIENSIGEKVEELSDVEANSDIDVKVNFLNTTDDDVVRTVVLASFNDGVLADFEKTEIVIPAMSVYESNESEIISGDMENGYIVAFMTDENGMPILPLVELGEKTVSDDEWSINYKDIAEPEKLVYATVNGNSQVIYEGIIKSDESGEFKVCARMQDDPDNENDALSGYYTMSWIDEEGNTGEQSVLFTNINESKDVIGEINKTAELEKDVAIAKITEILKNKRYALFIDEGSFDNIDVSKAAEIIYNSIMEKPLNEEDVKLSAGIISKAVEIVAIDEGININLFETEDILKLSESEIKDFYKKDYVTEKLQKIVTENLKNKDYKSFKEFYDALTEEFVLSVVEKPDGEDNAEEIIKYFADKIGTGANGKSSAYRAVMNNRYKSFEDLKEAFDKANSASSGSSPGGSGGGGSGGGSSSNKPSNMTVDLSIIQPENTDKTEGQIPYPVFSDIENVEWAKEAIVYLAEKQVLNGKGEYRFCPNDNVTRQELVKMIVLAFDYGMNDSEKSSFTDVSEWAKPYVDCAYKNGIVNGYSAEILGATDYVTREDMSVMIYRAALNAGFEFLPEKENIFADDDAISDYAKEAVKNLYNTGIINGTGNNEFSPKNVASRAQVAKMIYSIIKM